MKILFYILFLSHICFASPQGIPVESTITCGTGSTQLLAKNNNRAYWLIQNQGSDTTGTCHIKVGSAITGTEGFKVNSGQNWGSDDSYIKAPVFCKCDSSSQTIEALESNW